MDKVRQATMTDVARRAGVSQTTVSFVLNGIDAGLPDRTRQRVIDAARELNYSPNDAARRLASRRSRTLGLAFYDISVVADYRQAAATVMRSVYRAAEKRGNRLSIYTTHERKETGEDIGTYFAVPVRSREVDGMIVWDSYVEEGRLRASFDEPLPIVTLDRQVADVPCVVPDYDDGMRQVVQSLVAQGRRRLCLITHAEKVYRDLNFRASFDRATREAGVSEDNLIYVEEPPAEYATERTVERIIDDLLATPGRPQAILCAYDRSALAALQHLRVHDISVPDEIAVVGCAGLPICGDDCYQISTLDLRHDLMGSHAVDLVLRMVRGEDLRGTKVVVTPEYFRRRTA